MIDTDFDARAKAHAAAQFRAMDDVDFYRLDDGAIYAHFKRIPPSGPKRLAGYPDTFHLVTGCCHMSRRNTGPVIVSLTRADFLTGGTRITAIEAATVAPKIFDFLRSLDAEQVARLILGEEA